MTTVKPKQDDELHSYYERDGSSTVAATQRDSGQWAVFWPHTVGEDGAASLTDAEFRERFAPKTRAAEHEFAGRNGTPVGEPTEDGWLFDDMEDVY